MDSGYLPYTAFCAKESYLKENADLIQHFTNALQKGMDYVAGHSPEEIATVIAPQFSEMCIRDRHLRLPLPWNEGNVPLSRQQYVKALPWAYL